MQRPDAYGPLDFILPVSSPTRSRCPRRLTAHAILRENYFTTPMAGARGVSHDIYPTGARRDHQRVLHRKATDRVRWNKWQVGRDCAL